MNNLVIPYRANMGVQTSSPFSNTYSLEFDGIDDYVSLNSSIDLGINSTISLWVNFDAAYNGILLGEDSYSSDYFLYPFSTGFYVRIASVFKLYTNVHTYLTAGSWHHLAVVRSGDSVEIFVDGFSRETQTGFGAAISTKFDTIAAKPNGTLPLEGKIDELAVWDNNTVSISDIYNGGNPTDLADLSPIAWYRIGDNGVYKSPQWLIPNNENKDKVSNYSFEFDGVDDYINIGNAISFEYTDAFSFSTWIKPLPKSGVKYLYSKYLGGKGILIYLNSSSSSGINTLNFNLYNTNSGTTATRKRIVTNDINFAPVNVWTNIVLTYDGSGLASGINYYKNGVLQSSAVIQDNLQNNTIVNTEDAFLSAFSGVSSFLLGNQDEFAIYSTELSSADALAIYNGGEPTTISGAVAYYKMGEEANFTSNWLVDNSALDNYSKRSFEFDGIDDRIQLSSDFVASAEFTLSFWMKPVAVTGNGNIFPIGTFPDNQNHVRLAQIGVIYLKVQAVLCLFNEGVVGGGANNLVLNEWQHISFIRDSSNIITCYRNGAIFGATVTNSGTLTLNSIGRIIANTFGFQGGLDEIAYWNSDETANLSTIYNGGEPTTLPSGAVAHWRMGEDASFNGTNWTVPDNVGSNNGTSANMTVDDLVGEAPNYSGGGISSGMTIEDRIGEAPNSTDNALSYNMDLVDRVTDVPT